jgi:hypothetical protein
MHAYMQSKSLNFILEFFRNDFTILRIGDACRETGLVGGKIGKLFHLNDQDKMRLISNRLLYCVSPSLLLIHN